MDTSPNGSIAAIGVIVKFQTSCHLKALNNKTEQKVSQIKKMTILNFSNLKVAKNSLVNF